MSIFSKFEAAMQGIIEGSFGRAFPTRIQPVELSHRLERAMENNLSIGQNKRLAPNFYEVHLGSRDYADFQPQVRTLAQQFSDELIATARDRGYMLTTRPIITFVEDQHLSTGRTQIVTRLLDAHAIANDPNLLQSIFGIDATRTMTVEEAAQLLAQQQDVNARQPVPSEPLPPAWLTLYKPTRGQPMRLERPIIHIGRHLTNDIVVNEKRVSRFHAEIRCERGQFVVYDLGSTNGVKVNGVEARQPVPLRSNDTVTVGSYEFVFQRK
ncbi:MAG: DUF3662 and FHA domain-containing protein [Ktedonobacterales bacterium]